MGVVNIKRLEYVITNNCSGNCKHCSVKNNEVKDVAVQEDLLLDVIRDLVKRYDIDSVMTFGGEPLLRRDLVLKIHNAARENNIARRQIITNGYFSNDYNFIRETADEIVLSGINEILLSVDCFHQEYIDINKVELFVQELKSKGFLNLRFHPAWVVDKNNINKFNEQTKNILAYMEKYGYKVTSGNNIQLSGNAVKYLKDYYPDEKINLTRKCGEIKYSQSLDNIERITIDENGDVRICQSFVIGNITEDSIIKILETYDPNKDNLKQILLHEGIQGLMNQLNLTDASIQNKLYHECDICKFLISEINNSQG